MEAAMALVVLVFGAFALIALPVLLAMRIEHWRLKRGLSAFVVGLEHGRLLDAPGPGAWRLLRVEATHGECAVTLTPSTVAAGRRRRLVMLLVVRAPGALGEGTLAVRQGRIVATGSVATPGDPGALTAALAELGNTVILNGCEARVTVDLPSNPRAGGRLAALVAALAVLAHPGPFRR